MSYPVKKGATWPPLEATLKDKHGPILLPMGTTVRFNMRPQADPLHGTLRGGMCAVLDDGTTPKRGKVRYQWLSTDVDTAGIFLAEFKVTFNPGAGQTIQIVPNPEYDEIVVSGSLG